MIFYQPPLTAYLIFLGTPVAFIISPLTTTTISFTVRIYAVRYWSLWSANSPNIVMAFITEEFKNTRLSHFPHIHQKPDNPKHHIEGDNLAIVSKIQRPIMEHNAIYIPVVSESSVSIKLELEPFGAMRLPLELQEDIISWVAADLHCGFGTPKMQTTLFACMHVCHYWLSYARKYLYMHIYIDATKNHVPGLKSCYRNNPVFNGLTKSINLDLKSRMSITAFFVSQKLPSLECLCIWSINLQKESAWLYRAAAHLTSVHHLHLGDINVCTVAQLVRLINSFHSLSKLAIDFSSNLQELKVTRQPIPSFCNLPSCSLLSLKIMLIPGIFGLLDWLIKADSFVTYLKQLTLVLWNTSESHSCCKGVPKLLNHCSSTLEDLTLDLEEVFPNDEIMELGEVSLSHLTRLQRLTYVASANPHIQDWIIKQLEQLPFTNSLTEISFDLYEGLNTTKWKEIDGILMGKKFNSLHKVEVGPKTNLQYLPQLNSKGILTVYNLQKSQVNFY
ncbi:hypothetical protein QCA50_015293 [Cerrena zonata]|uniref:F-box domain-containing protein n=1 Tax=Cerrena zonata TaxID=2478898 RepID=A0AAW0FLQ2_9APHY